MAASEPLDDLSKLLLFADVAELESFTAAARRSGLSHSTVSKHVKALERSLRVQLLERTSRSMRLTEAGRLALEHARRIAAQRDALAVGLEELRGEIVGELRVAALQHLGPHLLQPATAAFLAAHPRARVTLLLHDEPLAFRARELDLALDVGLPADGSLIARRLLDNQVALVASPELLERRGAPTTPADLANYPTVAYARADLEVVHWSYLDGGERRSVTVDPVLRVTDGNALLDAARAGVGVAYVTRLTAVDDLAAGRLVRVLPEVELPSYAPIHVLRAPTEYVSPKIEAFLACLEAQAARVTSS